MSDRPDNRPLDIGAEIGGYQILAVLGQGGFGITYKAQNVFGELVAIKQFVFRSPLAQAASPAERAESEKIRAWAQASFQSTVLELRKLDHPNIVKVLHFIPARSTGFLVMELVDGVSLDVLLNTQENFDLQQLRGYVEPILDALDYVHGQGLVHRDVAPDNIMVRADGTPVLIDFGSIRQIAVDIDRAENQAGLSRVPRASSFAVVKQYYSPPEQYHVGQSLRASSDVYAIAAVLYRGLSGRPPADAQARLHGIGVNGHDAYVPLQIGDVGIAIDRALDLKADRRTGSIAELRRQLGWAAPDVSERPASPDDPDGKGRALALATVPLDAKQEQPPHAAAHQARIEAIQKRGAAVRHRRLRAAALIAATLAASVVVAGLLLHQRDRTILAEAGSDYQRLKAYVASCWMCLAKDTVHQQIAAMEAEDAQTFARVGSDPLAAQRYIDSCRVCANREKAREIHAAAVAQETGAYQAIENQPLLARRYLDECRLCQHREEAARLIALDAAEEARLRIAGTDAAKLRDYLKQCVICTSQEVARALLNFVLKANDAETLPPRPPPRISSPDQSQVEVPDRPVLTLNQFDLGIRVRAVTPSQAARYGIEKGLGVAVVSVVPGKLAASYGVSPGDIITDVNGTKITTPQQLAKSIRPDPRSSIITLTVVDDSETRRLYIRVKDVAAR